MVIEAVEPGSLGNMTIDGYRCIVCGKYHKARSDIGQTHLPENAKHYGWKIQPGAPKDRRRP